MDLTFTAAEEQFRSECRAWLHANVPRGLPSGDTREGFALHLDWERALFDARYAVVSWPEAYGGRDATFLVTGEVSWTDPAQSDEAIAWGREFWAAMGRHSTGGLYLNFPGLGEEKEELVRAGYGPNYDRLASLKATYDPANLFCMNLNITPAGA